MKFDVAYLMTLVQELGDNLPQVWPDILEISNRMQHILSVMGHFGGSSNIGPPVTDAGGKLVTILNHKGISHDEAKRVVSVFEQYDSRFGG